MNTVENCSKMCRVCCDRKLNNNLIFLLDAENKAIIKRLRACADITVSAMTKGRKKQSTQSMVDVMR